MKHFSSFALHTTAIILASMSIIILAALLLYITGAVMFGAIIVLQSFTLAASVYGLIRHKGN